LYVAPKRIPGAELHAGKFFHRTQTYKVDRPLCEIGRSTRDSSDHATDPEAEFADHIEAYLLVQIVVCTLIV